MEFFSNASRWLGISRWILTLRLIFFYLITYLSNMNIIGFYQYVGYRGWSLLNLPCNYNSKYLIDKLTILIFKGAWAIIVIIPMMCGDSILLQNIIFLVRQSPPIAVIMLIYLLLVCGCFAAPFYPSQSQHTVTLRLLLERTKELWGGSVRFGMNFM